MNLIIKFLCNNEFVAVDVNPAVTVLDFLRHEKRLTGTKEGCREGDCGACTVLVGSLSNKGVKYVSANSCLLPIHSLSGKHLATIEGLNNSALNKLQSAMESEGGTQCGFCTPGFIISMTNYLLNNNSYKYEDAIGYLDGNICRCTGYEGIKRALSKIISQLNMNPDAKYRIGFLVNSEILPSYFLQIPSQLKKLNSEISNSSRIKRNAEYFISGGTDLYVQKWEEVYEREVEFSEGDYESNEIAKHGSKLTFGGAVTIERLRTSKIFIKYFPKLENDLKLFGSLPIRNRATIAGNIVNASPIADASNIFLALGATVILSNKKNEREIPLKDFFLGYKVLNKRENERIKSIRIELPKKNYFFNYEKVSRRKYLDIASVNSSILIELQGDKIIDAKISAGGVAPTPTLLKSTSAFLQNRKVSTEIIQSAAQKIADDISPIGDARGSAEYKTLLLRNLFFAHFIQLFPDKIKAEKLV